MDAWSRLERLAQASPLYGHLLERDPSLGPWLEDVETTGAYDRTSFRHSWTRFFPADGVAADEAEVAARLRRWRLRMSLRIAYRSINGMADEPATVAELSLLGEFCIRRCLELSRRRWTERWGDPWDEENGRPARFCVLALGKLGGGELNFSSDIDLIYCYEGEGHCRRGTEAGPVTTPEYFTKLAETLTSLLTTRTADGFLFRVDVRLRPEGAWGPLIHSLSAIENYYSTAGQTWERLALIKASPVAGDLALGAELLDDLHSFRYPRRPPPSLLAEVAAMKDRTEREVVGQAGLDRDVKNGPGGIREVEFIAQSLQLLHAGRFPFLQTASTTAALEGLARYGVMAPGEASRLIAAYWHLRRVENRLQMRDESQTHALPRDRGEREAIALSLGYADGAAFQAELDTRREAVRSYYAGLFAGRGHDPEFETWWEFLTTTRVPEAAAARIARWFGDAPDAADALRLLVIGDHRPQITPDYVGLFEHLAANFDRVMPELAQPRQTLLRLGRCAECYGTRRLFLENCAANPQLFRVLALICDRSSYGVELLCAHPEILEEVLRPEMLRRRKDADDLAAELAAGPSDPDAYPPWLWLYVRAEQLRYAIGEMLGFLDPEAVESALTTLAEAVLRHLGRPSEALVVALGKFGGREMTLGSDLDLLFVAREGAEERAAAGIGKLRSTLYAGNPLGPTFALDLRLRPHGEAGPMAATLSSLASYHSAAPSGEEALVAQTWEKQMLVRARVVAGPADLAGRFQEWREQRLYATPLSGREEAQIWAMRGRIERERDAVSPPERAFKTGPGGMIDIEFRVQTLQLLHGHAIPALRQTGTRGILRALADSGILDRETAGCLAANFEFLKRIEFALRRDSNRADTVLPAGAAERETLARWLGFASETAFWADYTARLADTRRRVCRADPG